MARKRYEKLTPAEAFDRARKAAFAYWFGSEPLIVPVIQENEKPLFKLDPALQEKPWLFFFIDPLAASSRETVEFAGALFKRYGTLKIGFTAVIQLPYSFCAESDWVRKQIVPDFGGMTCVMDVGGWITSLFQTKDFPRILLIQQGKALLDWSSRSGAPTVEADLQRYLRQSDPGLPLPRAMPMSSSLKDAPEVRAVDSPTLFTGKWIREGDAMKTADPDATLTIECPAQKVGLIARATGEPVEASVLLAAEFPRERIFDEDLEVDLNTLSNPLSNPVSRKTGNFTIDEPRLYRLFNKLPLTHRKLVFSFRGLSSSDHQSNRSVSIYGLRFAD